MKTVAHKPLRIAFWTLITTSSLFWILAIFLLSSCTGSIFSDKKKKGNQSHEEVESSTSVPTSTVQKKNAPGAELVGPKRPSHRPVDDTFSEEVADDSGSVETKYVKPINFQLMKSLFPAQFSKLERSNGDGDISDFKLKIVVEGEKSAGKTDSKNAVGDIRTVTFTLLQRVKEDGSKPKAISPVKFNLAVKRDEPKDGIRNFYAIGKMRKSDDFAKIAISLVADQSNVVTKAHLQLFPEDENALAFRLIDTKNTNSSQSANIILN